MLAAWLAPRRIARAGFAPIAVMLLDICAVRARRGAARRRDGPAAIRRRRDSGARRRVLPRRPHDARDAARAGGLLRIGRAAAALHAPASLSAIRRAGAGDGRCSGRVVGGPGIAGFRAAAMGAASARRACRGGARCRRDLDRRRGSGRSASRRARCAGSCGRAASRSRTPPRSGRSRHCSPTP